MQDFKELKVWSKSHQLVLQVYRSTVGFPREERYGLTSQIRRAGVSIPANIAEGCGRGGRPELAQFLHVAAGSASELEYHLLLARDLDLMEIRTYEALNAQVTEVKRMLTALISTIRAPRQVPSRLTTDD